MRRQMSAFSGVLLVLPAVVTIGAPNPARAKSASMRSYDQARAELDAALSAAGGADALRSIKNVRRVARATLFNQGQGLDPEAPNTTMIWEEESIADFEKEWSTTDRAWTPAGGLRWHSLVVVKGDTGFTYNRLTAALRPWSAAAAATARKAIVRDPARVLLTAAARAETLRFLGQTSLNGRPHRVIAFADSDGTQITLYIDSRSRLLSKQETVGDDPVFGDMTTETLYSDYRKVAGVRLPFRLVIRNADRVTDDFTYSQITANAAGIDKFFEPPRGAVHVAPNPPSAVTLTKLGEGAYFVGGGSHNSMFVSFKDHVLLVEAPESADRVEAVLAKIRETVGNKPVRYVVPTHYHTDHIAGLRAAIAVGATVVTTRGNRALVNRLAATAHTIRPDALSRQRRAPSIEIIAKKRVFSDGTRTVEIYDIGPTPHVNEAVIAYLPAERVVFVSDLFNTPLHGPISPLGTSGRHFARALEELRLAVDRIAPGHGRLATMKDFTDSLAKPAPTPRPVGL